MWSVSGVALGRCVYCSTAIVERLFKKSSYGLELDVQMRPGFLFGAVSSHRLFTFPDCCALVKRGGMNRRGCGCAGTFLF